MASPERRFVDTNVFIYAYDTRDKRKHQIALEFVAEAGIVISTQVLGEFFNTVTRKFGLAVADARTAVERLAPLVRVSTDRALVAEAIDLCATKSLSYWDALIVAGAMRAQCSQLVTEDLNAGEVIAGVEIVNPFR